jgi:hypothetical protein
MAGQPGDLVGQVAGVLVPGLMDLPVALPTEPKEAVVLGDDLAARAGEVQRERRHVAAEVVDLEDQLLG